LADLPHAHVARADAADPDEESADVIACFFLLHEVPDDVKIRITRAMLGLVAPGGEAVFVDYHRPHRLHPLRPLMQRLFAWLEPFAPSMCCARSPTLPDRPAANFARSLAACIGSWWRNGSDRRVRWARATSRTIAGSVGLTPRLDGDRFGFNQS
jgi:hypothetical protein